MKSFWVDMAMPISFINFALMSLIFICFVTVMTNFLASDLLRKRRTFIGRTSKLSDFSVLSDINSLDSISETSSLAFFVSNLLLSPVDFSLFCFNFGELSISFSEDFSVCFNIDQLL